MRFKDFRQLAHFDAKTLKIVAVFSLLISILSLVVPIASQTLVNIVAFGQLYQPILVLVIVTFILLSASALIRICLISLVEAIQQRIFADIALKLADFLPRKPYKLSKRYENDHLVNRFFEFVVIQKSVSVLLISGVGVILQTFFGMLLLAFYSPILLAFDICIVIAMLLAIFVPMRSALRTSKQECNEKHNVASWLEEIASNPLLFKTQDRTQYAMQRAREAVKRFIHQRRRHFRRLLAHSYSIYAVSVIGSTSLLAIGGFLVINNQLSLGQLVASEVVLSAMASGFVQLSSYLEDFYDLTASTDKLQQVLNQPAEVIPDENKQSMLNHYATELGNGIQLNALHVSYSSEKQPELITDFNLKLPAGTHTVITSSHGQGKSTLLLLLAGMLKPSDGKIEANGMPLNAKTRFFYRQHIAFLQSLDIFNGTLLDNILVGASEVDYGFIQTLLNELELSSVIESLPDNLDTFIDRNDCAFSRTTLLKIILIRTIISKPSICFIDDLLDWLDTVTATRFVELFKKHLPNASLVVSSDQKKVIHLFSNRVSL